MQNMKSCRCPHHSLTAIFLVLLAITLILGNTGVIAEHTASIIWPIFLGLIGLQKAFERRCKCCNTGNCGCGCGCCGPDGKCSCSCCTGGESKSGKCC